MTRKSFKSNQINIYIVKSNRAKHQCRRKKHSFKSSAWLGINSDDGQNTQSKKLLSVIFFRKDVVIPGEAVRCALVPGARQQQLLWFFWVRSSHTTTDFTTSSQYCFLVFVRLWHFPIFTNALTRRTQRRTVSRLNLSSTSRILSSFLRLRLIFHLFFKLFSHWLTIFYRYRSRFVERRRREIWIVEVYDNVCSSVVQSPDSLVLYSLNPSLLILFNEKNQWRQDDTWWIQVKLIGNRRRTPQDQVREDELGRGGLHPTNLHFWY